MQGEYLDGDGDTDLLSASMWDNTIAWNENSGGAFGVQQTISDTGGPLRAAAADVDGDGDLDVLAAFAFDDAL